MDKSVNLFGSKATPSPICLGSVGFGTDISQEKSFELLDAFSAQGGNFIDTAHVYAAWLDGGTGASERTIGAWMRARGNRDQMVIATKGGHCPLDAKPKEGRLSRDDLDRHLSESLERLGVESIDLYWLHLDELARPVDEIMESLAAFKESGRIKSYGASNWSTERIQQANASAKAHGLGPFVANQPWWSLGAVGNSSDPLRDWHQASGLPMIPYSSQSNGYFGDANVQWARDGFNGDAPVANSFDTPLGRRRLRRAVDLGDEKGVRPSQIALAFLMSQSFPVFPIIGTGDLEHLQSAMDAATLRLTETERDSLLG
ncbi:MAG TPA: aldo/keto reductase [Polyangiaceae bacterium]|jgi:aryl-alcohol dehydrogenase-like predicted oxidoreductase